MVRYPARYNNLDSNDSPLLNPWIDFNDTERCAAFAIAKNLTNAFKLNITHLKNPTGEFIGQYYHKSMSASVYISEHWRQPQAELEHFIKENYPYTTDNVIHLTVALMEHFFSIPPF